MRRRHLSALSPLDPYRADDVLVTIGFALGVTFFLLFVLALVKRPARLDRKAASPRINHPLIEGVAPALSLNRHASRTAAVSARPPFRP